MWNYLRRMSKLSMAILQALHKIKLCITGFTIGHKIFEETTAFQDSIMFGHQIWLFSHSDYVNIIMAVFVAASTIGAANGTLFSGARWVTNGRKNLQYSVNRIMNTFQKVLLMARNSNLFILRANFAAARAGQLPGILEMVHVGSRTPIPAVISIVSKLRYM